jgi:hypothetical protein
LTVSVDQIVAADTILDNVAAAAEVADEIPMPFYHLCALLEKESNGRNVYGNDKIKLPDGTYTRKGVALSGFPGLVNKDNYAVFWYEVFTIGYRSNGVGPLQLTSKDFHTQIRNAGHDITNPRVSMLFGAKLYWSYFLASRAEGWSMKSSIRRAGTKYNTGEFGFLPYGDRLHDLATKWRDLVGVADVITD